MIIGKPFSESVNRGEFDAAIRYASQVDNFFQSAVSAGVAKLRFLDIGDNKDNRSYG